MTWQLVALVLVFFLTLLLRAVILCERKPKTPKPTDPSDQPRVIRLTPTPNTANDVPRDNEAAP